MKTYQKADAWLSALLIIVFTIAALMRQPGNIIAGYLVVGSWHIISMLIHQCFALHTPKGSSRYWYHRIVLGLAIAVLIGLAWPPLLMLMLYLLLYTAPIMALYYTGLCFYESYFSPARPLACIK